jgi:glycosyltransferase involved in cell wall biosynthesis
MSGLLALLDDVAGIAKVAAASVDDVVGQAAKAGTKAAGAVIDDAAVTPKYMQGFAPARELPIVWRIAKGSLKNKLLFLLPAGLRPVKDVIGLLQIFDRLAYQANPFHLAICGPVLDENYGRQVLAEVAMRSWASYAGIIRPEAMADAMRDADVIVNNSISEGLANSLLEAATLGIPILARDNPGNAALVRHDINGLLFDNDADCLRHASRLLVMECRQQLSQPDSSYCCEIEAKELQAILLEAISHRPKGK